MTDVIMPQMGESIAEGTITKWMKKVGDKVERDEPLFEISTDKVDAEIPAPAAGILQEIRVEPGATVPIHTVVGVIAAAGEAAAGAPVPPGGPAAAPPAPPPSAAATPAVAPPATPATPAVPASPPAVPAAPAAAPRAPAPPQAPATPPPSPSPQSDGAETARPPAPDPPAAPEAATVSEKPRGEMTVDELRQTRSSPVVRKIAAEHHVDISQVPGTGISGRVTKNDILGHLDARPAGDVAEAQAGSRAPAPSAPVLGTAVPPRPSVAGPTPPAPPASKGASEAQPFVPAYHPGERVEIVPMSPIRRRTAEHMTQSKRISAHVSTVWEIDMSRVDHLRKRYGTQYQERSGVKLTFLPFILKATVDAIKAFPILNTSVDGDSIVYKQDINIGMAVALDWGLIVPVIRNADEKNILGLARATNDLAERARSKKLKVDEVQGGTFTVTNPGVFGSLFGTPIINQPQVAILGVGTIEKRPVVRDDAIAIRTMAYLALTFDHRIVDGSDADRFMAHLKKSLQEFDESAL